MAFVYTSSDILDMLYMKHSEDVFIPECKNGPTQSVRHFSRMDALVVRKSWAHPSLIGYEIKVSRGDFLQDVKWRDYLPLCNEFFFVCPAKLIQPEELPANVGLLWTAGKRFVTKRKAVWRNVQIPESLWRYIVICRSKICRETEDRTLYWKQWLIDRENGKDIGYRVSRSVRQAMESMRRTVRETQAENKALEFLKKRAIELGCDPGKPVDEWQIESKLDKLVKRIPSDTLMMLRQARQRLTDVEKIITGSEL